MSETPPKTPAGYLVVKLGEAHRRQYVSLGSDSMGAPMLVMHQNVRALDAGKKPLLAVRHALTPVKKPSLVLISTVSKKKILWIFSTWTTPLCVFHRSSA